MAKTDKIQIKVTEGQKYFLQEIAKADDKTLTKYILDLVAEDLSKRGNDKLLEFLKK